MTEMKICNKCEIEKELNFFPFRKDTGNYNGSCKECKKLHMMDWKEKNREKYNQTNKIWRQNTVEYQRERGKKWRINNPEKIIEKKKRDYDKFKDRWNEKARINRQYETFMKLMEASESV